MSRLAKGALDRAGDFASLQALGAHSQCHCSASQTDLCLLKIGVPAALRAHVRVAHMVSGLRTLSANITPSGHKKTPS